MNYRRGEWKRYFIKNVSEKHRFYGHLGQIIITDLVHSPRPTVIGVGRDGGSDVTHNGYRYDIKTELRTCDMRKHFSHNVNASQIGNNCDAYAFMSYNEVKKEFTFCGLIWKKDFLEKAIFYPKGSAMERDRGPPLILERDNFEIADSYLFKGEKEPEKLIFKDTKKLEELFKNNL